MISVFSSIATPDTDIDTLLRDRAHFRSFIYTPLAEAIVQLNERRKDALLREKVHRFLSHDLPEPFATGPRLTLLRYVNTPNREVSHFLAIAKRHGNLPPLLCEYPQDKFVPSNTSKRFLGKIAFSSRAQPNDANPIWRVPIIDIQKGQNSAFADITTLWNQPLVAFHHDLFQRVLPDERRDHWYDISAWYRRHGPTAKQYYADALALFVRDGILFENFVVHQKEEAAFFRNIVLPAFREVQQATGRKPLIVALEPPETEGDISWLCYPCSMKAFVETKLATII
jgi:hypothetical protein